MHQLIPADMLCRHFCHKALEVRMNDLPLNSTDEMTKKLEAVSSSTEHIITEVS